MNRSDAYEVGDEVIYMDKYQIRRGKIRKVNIYEDKNGRDAKYKIDQQTRKRKVPHYQVAKSKVAFVEKVIPE